MKDKVKFISELIEPPVVVERYCDNGVLSHYELIDKSSGETLWSEKYWESFSKEISDIINQKWAFVEPEEIERECLYQITNLLKEHGLYKSRN